MYSISNYKFICNLSSMYIFKYISSNKHIGLLLFFFSLFCHAATYDQLETIQKAAEAHVYSSILVPKNGEVIAKAADLDSRIKATDCPIPLETSSNTKKSTSNMTVLVKCQPDNWRIYVPVKISISQPLVTLTRSISKGEYISSSDLTIAMFQLNAYRRQGYNRIDQVIGAKLKKNVTAGDIIEQGDICIVCRNEKVMIKAVKGNMAITTKGTALSDGTTGDQVRAKNDKSNRVVEGIVTGNSEITVYF